MNQKKIGGTKKKVTDAGYAPYDHRFLCVHVPVCHGYHQLLKTETYYHRSPFSWLFTIKGLSFDNFVKVFNQMNSPECLQELSGCNRNSNRTGYGTRSHAGLLHRA